MSLIKLNENGQKYQENQLVKKSLLVIKSLMDKHRKRKSVNIFHKLV